MSWKLDLSFLLSSHSQSSLYSTQLFSIPAKPFGPLKEEGFMILFVFILPCHVYLNFFFLIGRSASEVCIIDKTINTGRVKIGGWGLKR